MLVLASMVSGSDMLGSLHGGQRSDWRGRLFYRDWRIGRGIAPAPLPEMVILRAGRGDGWSRVFRREGRSRRSVARDMRVFGFAATHVWGRGAGGMRGRIG